MKIKAQKIALGIGILVLLVLTWGCATALPPYVNDLNAQQTKELITARAGDADFVILDIRTPAEFARGHLVAAVSIDYYSPQFKSFLAGLERDKDYLVYCRSGHRSRKALRILDELGFRRIYHLRGGINAWQAAGYELVQ